MSIVYETVEDGVGIGWVAEYARVPSFPKGVISEIKITDPDHALYGRSFPLLPLRAERGRDYLVFVLPDGRRRAARKSSNNLGAVAREDHVTKVFGSPRVSVRTLVPLARHLRT